MYSGGFCEDDDMLLLHLDESETSLTSDTTKTFDDLFLRSRTQAATTPYALLWQDGHGEDDFTTNLMNQDIIEIKVEQPSSISSPVIQSSNTVITTTPPPPRPAAALTYRTVSRSPAPTLSSDGAIQELQGASPTETTRRLVSFSAATTVTPPNKTPVLGLSPPVDRANVASIRRRSSARSTRDVTLLPRVVSAPASPKESQQPGARRNKQTPPPLDPLDIVCGHNQEYSVHHGNQMFRSIILSYVDQFAAATQRRDRANLTKEIGPVVKSERHRFVKLSACGKAWVEIDDAGKVRDKIGHALRTAVRKKKNKHNS